MGEVGHDLRDDDTVKSVKKAAAILRTIAAVRRGMTIAEVCRHLGMPKSVVRRLCHTMCEEHLLVRNASTSAFSLSPRVLELASAVMDSSPLISESLAPVRNLSATSGMTAALGVIAEDQVLFLVAAEPDNMVRVRTRVGSRTPLHCTAIGKVLLAFLPRSERRRLLARLPLRAYTEHTITSVERLSADLDRIGETGYALNFEEHSIGVSAISVPVLGPGRCCVAAVSLGIPKPHLPKREIETLVGLAQEASRRIEQRLLPLSEAVSLVDGLSLVSPKPTPKARSRRAA